MKTYLKYSATLIVILFTALLYSGCKIDPIEDLNNPSAEVISENATLSEIQNVVTGIESGTRNQLNTYFDAVSVIGREWYRFSGSDPRFTSDLLGKGSAVLDANTFYTVNAYRERYRVVRNCNILIDALTNTAENITEAERKAGTGYAKTMMAFQILMAENQQWDNGVRVDVKDPDNLGPFIAPHEAALDAIAGLLNQGYDDLKAGSSDFVFAITMATDNKTVADFIKFNRALAARLAVYRQKWTEALDALNESFLDLNGSLNNGVFYLYSTAGGDALNPVYFVPNTSGEIRVAQKDFVSDAEAGDTRVALKVTQRTDPAFQDGLQSNYDVTVYPSNTSPIPIIRNEELILIHAEANAQTGDAVSAVSSINTIRAAAGLTPYAGGLNTSELIDEILKQRRYSLYGEGHRWVDMRRYNKLSLLPVDRTDDDVWVQFPRPANEK